MPAPRKQTSFKLRKQVWDYTRSNPVFTSLELKESLNLKGEVDALKNQIVSVFLKELVSWQYLSSQKQGVTVRYYVNI